VLSFRFQIVGVLSVKVAIDYELQTFTARFIATVHAKVSSYIYFKVFFILLFLRIIHLFYAFSFLHSRFFVFSVMFV